MGFFFLIPYFLSLCSGDLSSFEIFLFFQESFYSTFIKLLLNARHRTRLSGCGNSVYPVGTAWYAETVLCCGVVKTVGLGESESLSTAAGPWASPFPPPIWIPEL